MVNRNQAMGNPNASKDTSSTEVIVYNRRKWRNLTSTRATSAPLLTENTGEF